MSTRVLKVFSTSSASDSAAPLTAGVVVSGTNTYYSNQWTGSDADGYGLQVEWSGTPTGVFTLWASDKPTPSEADDTDWVQDTAFVPVNPAGAAGKFRDEAFNAKARRKRLKYVNASGTGTIMAWASVPVS